MDLYLVGPTLQALYDSEIPFSISALWDGGFDWRLGIEGQPGYASGNADTLQEAVKQLTNTAVENFPESAFARSRPGNQRAL